MVLPQLLNRKAHFGEWLFGETNDKLAVSQYIENFLDSLSPFGPCVFVIGSSNSDCPHDLTPQDRLLLKPALKKPCVVWGIISPECHPAAPQRKLAVVHDVKLAWSTRKWAFCGIDSPNGINDFPTPLYANTF